MFDTVSDDMLVLPLQAAILRELEAAFFRLNQKKTARFQGFHLIMIDFLFAKTAHD